MLMSLLIILIVLRAVERAAHQESWRDKTLKELNEHFSEPSIVGVNTDRVR